MRVEFDLSASANLAAPLLPNLLPVQSQNEMEEPSMLQLRSIEVRDVFDLSTSDNILIPFLPISQTVFSENEMKQQHVNKYTYN
jgi:hypothetical protein